MDFEQEQPSWRSLDRCWLTTEEAAEYLRLAGPSSIRAAIARGLLRPDARNGKRGSYLFRVDTLDRYAMSFVPQPRERKTRGPAQPGDLPSRADSAARHDETRRGGPASAGAGRGKAAGGGAKAPPTDWRAMMRHAIEEGIAKRKLLESAGR